MCINVYAYVCVYLYKLNVDATIFTSHMVHLDLSAWSGDKVYAQLNQLGGFNPHTHSCNELDNFSDSCFVSNIELVRQSLSTNNSNRLLG